MLTTPVMATEKQRCQWKAQETLPDNEFEQAPIIPPDFLTNKPIGEISQIHYSVFSDDKALSLNWLYQWLNDIHTTTKNKVIIQELSFSPNDNFDPVKVIESERLIRRQKYIYDARIRPISLCDDKVNIEISTRDTWSITPAFNVSHNGDETKTKLSLTESNFLGSGKLISLSRSSDNQRDEFTLFYRDPNVGGTHLTNEIEFSENSDGQRHFVSVNRPFYALDSRLSYGASYNNEQRNDPLYQREDKITDITHSINDYQLFFGHSLGYQDNQTSRWRYGIHYIKDVFTAVDPTLQLKPLNSRTSFYPWIEFSLLENRYTTLTNFHSIKRTEDINLGRNFSASIGYSPQSWSDDKDRIIFHVRSENAFKFKKGLITIAGSVSGEWLHEQKSAQNITANVNGQYYHFTTNDWVFFAGASYNLLKNPYIENQLFLGGDTGLRGYPVRYQMGKSNAILNIEQRFYSDLYWWKLIRVGAAAYIDIGKNWGDQSPLNTQQIKDSRWLSNVGIGLRLTPSRADANHVIHVDLAFPLGQHENVDDARFMVTVKQSF